jgi:hypothetical protein
VKNRKSGAAHILGNPKIKTRRGKMKSANKTKQELIDELEALQERVSVLENCKRNSGQVLENFGQKRHQSFSQMAHMYEAIFVSFDRKLEFINERFAELFDISPEEACSCNFDPMTLIAPESRLFIQKQYQEGCRGAYTTKQCNYTGLSKEGLKIDCETFLMFIPYKWGVAIQGALLSPSIDKVSQMSYSDLPFASNALPAGAVMQADGDHLFMQARETFRKSDGLLLEQIPRVGSPIRPANGGGGLIVER